MSHHGDSPINLEEQRAMSEAMRKLFGEYPDGKLNANDEGALALIVGNEKGKVIIKFPKPVAWVGFTPEQALDIAQSLIDHARKCGSPVPLVLRVGGTKP